MSGYFYSVGLVVLGGVRLLFELGMVRPVGAGRMGRPEMPYTTAE